MVLIAYTYNRVLKHNIILAGLEVPQIFIHKADPTAVERLKKEVEEGLIIHILNCFV
jgi:hypothetical protein